METTESIFELTKESNQLTKFLIRFLPAIFIVITSVTGCKRASTAGTLFIAPRNMSPKVESTPEVSPEASSPEGNPDSLFISKIPRPTWRKIQRYVPDQLVFEERSSGAIFPKDPYNRVIDVSYNSAGKGVPKFLLFSNPIPGCDIPVKQFVVLRKVSYAPGTVESVSVSHLVCTKNCPEKDHDAQTITSLTGFVTTEMKVDLMGVLGYACGGKLAGSTPLLQIQERCANETESHSPSSVLSLAPMQTKCPGFFSQERNHFEEKLGYVFQPGSKGITHEEQASCLECQQPIRTREDRVAHLYQKLLRRPGTHDEITTWAKNYSTLGGNHTDRFIVLGFLTSAEYRNLSTSNELYVATLYQDVLGREGTTAEIKAWAEQLRYSIAYYGKFEVSPEISLVWAYEAILNGFLDSDEYQLGNDI